MAVAAGAGPAGTTASVLCGAAALGLTGLFDRDGPPEAVARGAGDEAVAGGAAAMATVDDGTTIDEDAAIDGAGTEGGASAAALVAPPR